MQRGPGMSSRINDSKIYTVEHDVRVLNIGRVHELSIASLRSNSYINRVLPGPDAREEELETTWSLE
jgi:hypothetical protein